MHKGSIFFVFLLCSGAVYVNYWSFNLSFRSGYYRSAQFPSVYADGSCSDAPSCLNEPSSVSGSSSMVVNDGVSVDSGNTGDPSAVDSGNTGDPSAVDSGNSNPIGGNPEGSTNNGTPDGCDLSNPNPAPGCVDVEPGDGSGGGKKKHPHKDPLPCKTPCANNTSGGGPIVDDNPPPNETVPLTECDDQSSLFEGLFQGAFGACNGLNVLSAESLFSFSRIDISKDTSPLTSTDTNQLKNAKIQIPKNFVAYGTDKPQGNVGTDELCYDGIDNDHNGLVNNGNQLCISSKLPEQKLVNLLQDNKSQIARITLHDYQNFKLLDNISDINATSFENQSAFLNINNTNIKLFPPRL